MTRSSRSTHRPRRLTSPGLSERIRASGRGPAGPGTRTAMANHPKRAFHIASEPDIKAGEVSDVYFARTVADPPRQGHQQARQGRDPPQELPPGRLVLRHPRRHRGGGDPPRGHARGRVGDGRGHHLRAVRAGGARGGQLPRLGGVRDRAPRLSLPGLRHRHQGGAVQARGGRAPGDLLRRAPHASRAGAHDRAQRLHRRLRRRGGDQGRRAHRRRSHGHHSPCPRPHVRRHGGGAPRLPRGGGSQGAAGRPHRHPAGREVRGHPRGGGARARISTRSGWTRRPPGAATSSASSRRCAGSWTSAASSTSRSSPRAASTSTRSSSSIPLVDGYGVGTSIANAPVLSFALDIMEIEGRPMAKRGKRSGAKQVWRVPGTVQNLVLPAHKPAPRRAGRPARRRRSSSRSSRAAASSATSRPRARSGTTCWSRWRRSTSAPPGSAACAGTTEGRAPRHGRARRDRRPQA